MKILDYPELCNKTLSKGKEEGRTEGRREGKEREEDLLILGQLSGHSGDGSLGVVDGCPPSTTDVAIFIRAVATIYKRSSRSGL